MSDVYCLTQIDRAIRATLEAELVPSVAKRVLGPEEDVGADRPIPARFLLAVITDLGDEDPTSLGEAEGDEDAWEEREIQVDVMAIVDGGDQAARQQSIQRDRERRAREQARRDQEDLRDRIRAETEAAWDAERARRDAELAARDAARNGRRDQARHDLSRAIYVARRQRQVSGTELIARHDAAAGREAARVDRADLAEQLAPALAAAPPDAIARAVERCPSLKRYPAGMASPKVRTAVRSGDISAWDFDRQLGVAATGDEGERRRVGDPGPSRSFAPREIQEGRRVLQS